MMFIRGVLCLFVLPLMALASQNEETLTTPKSPVSVCEKLAWITIQPNGPKELPKLACDKKKDRLSCLIKAGYARFYKTELPGKKTAYQTKSYLPSNDEERSFLGPILESTAVQEMNALRVKARLIAQSPNVCEPNFVLMGGPYFGLGPAFIDSTQFVSTKYQQFSNVLAIEDSKVGQGGSIQGLLSSPYYPIVIVHELAHGLLQDLYGVENFSELVGHSVSRVGHSASIVTDPAMAWFEGFAEGFEAYFGEKNLKPLPTPNFDFLMNLYKRRLVMAPTQQDSQPSDNWSKFLKILRGGADFIGVKNVLSHLDESMVEFLYLERQDAIRTNQFIRPGFAANLSYRYDIDLESPLDAVNDSIVENIQSLYSKEGVVAYLVYSLLKAGLQDRTFEIIYQNKPKNVWEFYQALVQQLSPDELALISHTLISIFTPEGRTANLVYLNTRSQDSENSPERLLFERKLQEISLPYALPAPSELWVEFQNNASYLTTSVDEFLRALKQSSMGTLSRFNLVVANKEQVIDFIHASNRLPLFSKEDYENIISSLFHFRKHVRQYTTIRQFTIDWTKHVQQAEPALIDAVRAISRELRKHALVMTP